MERNFSLKSFVFILIIFYTVGAMGIIIPATRGIFINLIPLALLLSVVLLGLFHRPRVNVKAIGIFIFIILFSYFAEVAGVKTGIIFGSYLYGDSLGPKILETPVLIGLNWLLLVYCTKVISDRLTDNSNIKTLISPLLMVGYDLVLEQCAPVLGMWYWSEETVPIKNYLAWFILSLIFHIIIRIYKISFFNKLAIPVFVIQFLFFVALFIYFSLFPV